MEEQRAGLREEELSSGLRRPVASNGVERCCTNSLSLPMVVSTQRLPDLIAGEIFTARQVTAPANYWMAAFFA